MGYNRYRGSLNIALNFIVNVAGCLFLVGSGTVDSLRFSCARRALCLGRACVSGGADVC